MRGWIGHGGEWGAGHKGLVANHQIGVILDLAALGSNLGSGGLFRKNFWDCCVNIQHTAYTMDSKSFIKLYQPIQHWLVASSYCKKLGYERNKTKQLTWWKYSENQIEPHVGKYWPGTWNLMTWFQSLMGSCIISTHEYFETSQSSLKCQKNAANCCQNTRRCCSHRLDVSFEQEIVGFKLPVAFLSLL